MTDRFHILTLIIENQRDVPRIRNKTKLLARATGCGRLQVTRLAAAASEMARLLLTRFSGGKINLAFVRPDPDEDTTDLELAFAGTSSCIMASGSDPKIQACPLDREALLAMPPLPALKSIFYDLQVKGGIWGLPLAIRCRSRLQTMTWGPELLEQVGAIRRELFADTEESYLENLRAKHDEVVRLLRDARERNQLLDRMNSELLQLTNDLEELAQERTIIEMSLKIADQIRNPATVIGGLARQVQRKMDPGNPATAKIRQIISQADRIDRILHQFHRMAAERHNLFRQESLPELIRDSIQGCPIIRQRRIRTVLEGLDRDVRIHANRKILRVALVHIFRQAATATPRDGSIFIRLVDDNQTIALEVTDQGQGLPAETLARLDRAPGDDEQGEYTGLMLVRQILAEHHGSLVVENLEAPLHGCRYRMDFPRTWEEQSGPPDDMANLSRSP